MAVKTQWWFDNGGVPVKDNHAAAGAAICVRVETRVQAIAEAETLRPQVEALYAAVIAAMKDPSTTVASAVDSIFVMNDDEIRAQEADRTLQERDLVFVVYSGADPGSLGSSPVGFSRIFELAYFDILVGSALLVDIGLSQVEQDAIITALFHTTQTVGEALVQELLAAKPKRAGAELEGTKVPTSKGFWRSLFGASDFAKQLMADSGFVEEVSRLEMTKDLKDLEDGGLDSAFTDEFEVSSLDLSDHAAVRAFYEVVKAAFDPDPLCFDAWKIHYAQQPRFAPELSFTAKKRGNSELVAAIAIELVVEGEGGGENETRQVFVTHGKLLAHKSASEGGAAADQELQQLLDAIHPDALVLPSSYEDRKRSITEQAITAYVCGAATLPEYRGKGLVSGLLKLSFCAAAKYPRLERVVLGTDVVNTSAIRAYKRAGMVETKRFSTGSDVVKHVTFAEP